MNKEELIHAVDRIFNNCEEIDLHNFNEDKTGYKMINDIIIYKKELENKFDYEAQKQYWKECCYRKRKGFWQVCTEF